MNVLVVDDEIVQIESLKRGLRSRGYKVLQALDAHEALNQLRNAAAKVDLVITDYAMPTMNGLELLKSIRELRADLPVILMTAYGRKDLVIDALRNRCDSFIEKPFTLDQIVEEIDRIKADLQRDTVASSIARTVQDLVHQINNPLACIRGSAEMAIQLLGDSVSVGEYIDRIIASTNKIVEINNEMLKSEADSDEPRELLDMNAIADGCVELFIDVMLLKGVSVRRDCHPSPLYFVGHRFGMEQALRNLILNAIEAMNDTDARSLKITTKPSENGSCVSISVEDSGCGIPDHMLEKIFDPHVSGKRHGTGLGLDIARNIIKKHHGKILVESWLGKGTTFTVDIPLAGED